jgi:16S rRNA (cytosine967-C5)-methyltransferase
LVVTFAFTHKGEKSTIVIMSRNHSHLNTTKTILSNYKGQTPFALELKQFFSTQKKYGSNDRRQIRNLCYCYFRLARGLNTNLSIEEKILQAYFLCTSTASQFLEELKPEWLQFVELSIEEKCNLLGLSIEKLFPFLTNLEDSIDKSNFVFSHLIQPDLFLRIRPNQEHKVKTKLDNALINYTQIDTNCIALTNTTQIEQLLSINKEVVIQDYASQRVGSMLDLVKKHFGDSKKVLSVWDCCAGSGGKSILAFDKLGNINITVSDIRTNILFNLKKRLQEANIMGFTSNLIDLTNSESVKTLQDFDLIIADVPCTGSGTWSRTPERLVYFEENEIDHYAQLQKTITKNIQSKLKPGAFFLLIKFWV